MQLINFQILWVQNKIEQSKVEWLRIKLQCERSVSFIITHVASKHAYWHTKSNRVCSSPLTKQNAISSKKSGLPTLFAVIVSGYIQLCMCGIPAPGMCNHSKLSSLWYQISMTESDDRALQLQLHLWKHIWHSTEHMLHTLTPQIPSTNSLLSDHIHQGFICMADELFRQLLSC